MPTELGAAKPKPQAWVETVVSYPLRKGKEGHRTVEKRADSDATRHRAHAGNLISDVMFSIP